MYGARVVLGGPECVAEDPAACLNAAADLDVANTRPSWLLRVVYGSMAVRGICFFGGGVVVWWRWGGSRCCMYLVCGWDRLWGVMGRTGSDGN